MQATYANLCPICGKDLSLNEVNNKICHHRNIQLCRLSEDELFEEFLNFFEKTIGKPRKIQRMWAKRILRNESFAAVAPTGVGKTSFGVAISIFLALKSKKCYILLPTTLLVNQVVLKVEEYAKKAGIDVALNANTDKNLKSIKVAYYHGTLKKAEKERFFNVLNDADLLITTTQFLSKHFDEINTTFDFIFVDDVDAILKTSKNVDRILKLLGFQYKNGWKSKTKGCLMVSTATAKKGRKAELFRRLLNFDIGSSTFTIRNIDDIAINSMEINVLAKILTKMGKGGIIYAKDGDEAEKLYEFLKDSFKVGIVKADKKKDFERFRNCEIDYLIGTAYYHGTLVRGLDLPEKIRFAVFYGCPTFRVRIEDMDNVSENVIKTLAYVFQEHEEAKRFLPIAKLSSERLAELKNVLKQILENLTEKEIRKKEDVVITKNEVVFPDIRTYIQGSGRTSRLFAGGVTKGVSFLLEESKEILNAFIERARYYDIEFEIKELDAIEFNKLKREVDESREKFRKKHEFDLIKPALFIVESPTKAKLISRFFGKPSVKVVDNIVAYETATSNHILIVTACLGHITDLTTDRGFHGVEVNGKFVPIYSSIKRCRSCGYQFTSERDVCPKCNSDDIDDSKRRIDALRKLAHDAEFVIIGTDPDSEGEKIAWDLKNLLAGCGEIKRAEFHEVTRKAVFKALKNLRDVDLNLVKAQIVRRIEDRWIGFVLSQKLWEVFKNKNLSAGRAQTPILGWIIDRAKEHRQKKKIVVIEELNLTLEHDKEEFEIEIELIEEKTVEKTPLSPYTTDTMLRDANAILKFNARKCMDLAQTLFESGLITYHRTDSTRVSEAGLRIAREYLKEDFVGREWFAEGAHECIRPTRAIDKNTLQRLIYEGVIQVDLKWEHLALYDLIFRRFMASQCKNFVVKVAKYKIKYDGKSIEEERVLNAKGKAYELYKGVWMKKALPTGKFEVKAKLLTVPKVPLFTQSEIIQLMKERGIGRPSTYATIVDKLFIRKYVDERNNRIYPTKRGISVYNYLAKHYANFVSDERTRILEEKMDEIEKGEVDYLKALEELYNEVRAIE
ncbi:reverse gyrase [Archaeoglobales archaeon]|nr:MAG: reverse gyrase [Archaeoglobales archaeon]